MSTTLRHIAAAAVTIFGIAACSYSDSGGSTSPPSESKTYVVLSVHTDSVRATTSKQISARVTDQTGLLKLVPVSWKSSDPSVAMVSEGIVTGIAPGTALVVASAGDGADTARIVVTPDGPILDVQPSAATVAVGDTIAFIATLRETNGDIVPANGVTWISSDTVAAKFVKGGTLVARTEGELSISAEAQSLRGSSSVRVFRPPVASVTISPVFANVYKGAQLDLDVTLRDQQGRVVEGPVSFGSSNYSRATVTNDGVVTGLAAGSVVITATSGSKTGSAAITVLSAPAASASLSLSSDTVLVGVELQATVTVLDASGTPLSGRTIGYQSANLAVATVSPTGIVKGIAAGSTDISAIVDNIVATKRITVRGRLATLLSITPGEPSVSVGHQSQLVARVLDQNGSEIPGQSIIWSSANPGIATVSQSGLVTALSGGSTTISAVSGGLAVSVVVSVVSTSVARVMVSPSTTAMVIGGSPVALLATAFDANENILPGRAATWSSLNPAVASVSSSGVLSAISAGSATVIANIEGKTASVAVTVSSAPAAPVTSVTVTLASTTLNIGQQTQATAVLKDAQGNVLSRAITWSSLDTTVAKVSATGLITAYSGGTVAIIARSEEVSGSASVTVNTPAPTAVASVTLVAPTQNLTIGQSVQSVVTLKDAQGNILTGRTISYSTENSSIVTVQASGVITGVGAGTTNVRATSEGKSATLGMTVNGPGGVNTVTVTLASPALSVGQTTQATAVAKDGSGAPLSGTPTWASSNSAVATVSTTGLVSAVGSGSALVTANLAGTQGSASLGVTAPTGTSPDVAPAELPRSVPSFSIPAPTRTYTILTNFQRALDTAKAGDEIRLSGTFVGNYVLPTKACGSWITVRSVTEPPAAGTRVTPMTAAGFAKIISPSSAPALKTTNPTCGWRLLGIEITGSLPQTSIQYGLLWLGDGGYVGGGETQTDISRVPQQFIVDRVYLHGSPTLNSMRCLALNTGATIIRDSWLSECHASGFDSQAIWGANGPGPYLIENNRLEGAGENVMFGGADPAIPGMVPADITIRRNHIIKPLSWRGGPWSIKNLFEMKTGLRLLVEGNVFENSWPAAQEGYALIIKSNANGCQCTQSGTRDFTFRYNIVRNAPVGFGLDAADNSYGWTGFVHTQRVRFEHNLFTEIGAEGRASLMILAGDLADVAIVNNTLVHAATARGLAATMAFSGGAARRLAINDNVLTATATYALWSDGGLHAAALTAFANDGSWQFARNVVGAMDPQYVSLNPPASWYPNTVAGIGLAADYSLAAPSPYKGRGLGGTDPGADILELGRRTAGVIVP